ncbi:type II toxin-antitoxin system VapC family toxin [Janibacter limosus]|uniref:Type II toxin-antitoxin system VapC family toxin n=1 Tax=Janibacter limosus TaxID=53458 RepID=A0AC61U618_9MICO|nr:type II toxin-antitoxin system VapC family toxin [Janibacter limosus]UUZ45461.1 type II toxin-antitoxin system VapC family toxin [Janibacter limosus]
MIPVDTSIWIDHLRAEEPELVARLQDDAVGCHPYVIEELALGSIRERDRVVGLLADLHTFPVVTHRELLELVDRRRLWGRGLSAVDTHLLGSVALVPGGRLWTRDRRLLAAARDVGVRCHDTL